jgi:hypothetical protein
MGLLLYIHRCTLGKLHAWLIDSRQDLTKLAKNMQKSVDVNDTQDWTKQDLKST